MAGCTQSLLPVHATPGMRVSGSMISCKARQLSNLGYFNPSLLEVQQTKGHV